MRLGSKIFASAALAVMLGTPTAFAQDTESTLPPQLQGMPGDWFIAQEDEDLPGCAITLLADQAIGGYGLTVPEPCPAPFPTADLAAWNVDENDTVYFIDPLRHVVLKFLEMEDGLFATEQTEDGTRFYLVQPMAPE